MGCGRSASLVALTKQYEELAEKAGMATADLEKERKAWVEEREIAETKIQVLVWNQHL